MSAADHRHQPFYCEENVWWLLQHPDLETFERHALFISNELRQCPVWEQRVAPAGEFVVWDYHVVAIVVRAVAEAWDLDTRLGMPLPLGRYLEQTFPARAPIAPPFVPRFRLVAAAELLATFRSDRSHMRREHGWLQPPPCWPAPRPPAALVEGEPRSNLMRFVDMSDDVAGEVMDLPALKRRFDV